MSLLFPLAIFCAFIPISLPTPVGYISPIDLILVLMSVLAVINAVTVPLYFSSRAKRMLILSILTYLLWIILCVTNGQPLDLSSYIKYFIFMIMIPVLIAVNIPANRHGYFGLSIASIFSFSGLVLALVAVLQIARGQALSDSGDAYYIILLGQLVHKNTVGALLVYGTIGAAWCGFKGNSILHVLIAAFQVMVTLLIGNRSSFLVEVIFSAYIVFTSGMNLRTLKIILVFTGLGVVAGTAIVSTGLLDAQIERLTSLSQVGNGEMTDASSRLTLWSYAWNLIVQQPLNGYGFGNFLYSADDWLDGRIEPHNAILQIIYNVGFVGFSTFLVMFLIGLRGRNRGSSDNVPLMLMMFGYVVNAMVGIIWIRGEGHLFWILFFLISMGFEKSYRVIYEPSRPRPASQPNVHLLYQR